MLTEARRGEIALLYVKRKISNSGITLNNNTRREIGNTAKDLGIPYAEALEFAEGIVRELVEETFVKNKDDHETKKH